MSEFLLRPWYEIGALTVLVTFVTGFSFTTGVWLSNKILK